MGSLNEPKRYVVIGGNGFLGKRIVDCLLTRGVKKVVVLDIAPAPTCDPRCTYIQGDICNKDDLMKAFKGATTVIHTASPLYEHPYEWHYKVNVEGTQNVVEVCIAQGVKQLIYTSSANVVFGGSDIKGGDETMPFCKRHLDVYGRTKEMGERIALGANGKGGLATVAIRPAGIFGPGDKVIWPGFIEAAKHGNSKYILGKGDNMMDWTYVDNVALAHILAAEKLSLSNPNVAGQAFFITNDEPIPFWDMVTYVWKELDYPTPKFKIPYWIAYLAALFLELIAWIISPIYSFRPTYNYVRFSYAGHHNYFKIEKAKKHLGYKPIVPLRDAMKHTLKSFEHMRNRKRE